MPAQSQLQIGARGSVLFRGKFYDNITVERKGVTSLDWPKAKLKLRFHKKNVRRPLPNLEYSFRAASVPSHVYARIHSLQRCKEQHGIW